MSNTVTNKLLETYIFRSDKPSRVKYEIYGNDVELTAAITIYREEPFGIHTYSAITLNASKDHPEYALEEVRKHFEKTYA
ncbi:TPA: DNA gyrase subunit B [Serratia rubidaea]|nr:DNA gyrase subunit B [Serratia rubidaea]HDJ1448647.1 DNA gyrase subunit B [Serratia rubidaea]HDJ1462426.1 DNA gyrase subunit B [Serratia rubidaea]HDJ2774270.1 DNA gyrase subunit B [Serratia rubidaea]